MNKFIDAFNDIRIVHIKFLKNLFNIIHYIEFIFEGVEEFCSDEIKFNEDFCRKIDEYKRDFCILKSRNKKINAIFQLLRDITLEIKKSDIITDGKIEKWLEVQKKYKNTREDFEEWLKGFLKKCTFLERIIISKND